MSAKYVRTASGYLMVLTEGDDLFARLTDLASAEQVPAASFTAFGFAGKVTFGFFDFEKREYRPAEYAEREMTGINGTLAWKDGKPSIHAHGVGGGAGLFGGRRALAGPDRGTGVAGSNDYAA